jgi:uncharacterized HAD superfamily protein|tara:strand:- start:204 stop:566 length:363 start_codon:yes stop_codon:yes gene_type:complete
MTENIKNFLIDIDGTVCDDIPNEEWERYSSAKLFPDAKERLLKWHEDGHKIYFFTAREEKHRDITEKWLNDNGFEYHGLIMGKPRGGNYHWIDNLTVKATQYLGSFTELVKTNKNIETFE